ncbi:Gluconate transport-inducing protein [Coemansia sp. RSA 1813]|nr:Gluconate transport-inducing protein [Coemansia sp. RSA 1646]KAJ1773500.1 Gluconate transport-inducing protein [Coemansia sp. RSA 1843]KAJ2085867.1 Gluconate transport-inducing protein [Coemansia sp. RSA 986]KAJ2216406.1 Gluconate transport-inducing protein [Coemansia sp. RSA 487]KAJ2570807.1 Gluconate transport-inducing protein [Coemansia sp. RSA 1813]
MTETYHGFIDTARDALLIFEACNAGLLPRVQRRFSDRERQTIRSGAVYVWDEEETGMRRWTDGRTWSPSRVHGCFLIYYELEGRRHQFVSKAGSANGGTRGSRGSRPAGQGSSSRHAPYDPSPPSIMQKEQGLIKKALSLCTNDKHKLHLVCYYSREDVEAGCLTSPTNDPMFNGIEVYEERYPEISYSNGRLDRYGGGRARSSAGSSMSSEKRSQAYRNEVYRYPSYGPYAGPIRHVNVPPVYTQQIQQVQAPLSGTMDAASPPSSGHSQTQVAPYHSSSSSSSSSLGLPAQNGATPSSHSIGPHYSHHQPHIQVSHYTNSGYSPRHHHYPVQAANPPGQNPSTNSSPQARYANNAHLYPVETNSSNNINCPTPISTGHSHGDSVMTAPVYKHSPPSAFLPSPPGHTGNRYQKQPQPQLQPQSQPPVWQHCEPPRVYTGSNSAQQPAVRTQHTSQQDHRVWSSGRSGSMTHVSDSSALSVSRKSPHSLRISGSQPPHTMPFTSLASPSSTPYMHALQQQPCPREDATLVRLPSIEKLSTLPLPPAAPTRPESSEQHQTNGPTKKHAMPPAITPVNGSSASNMSSEDIRQLASLRLSLHQWS